MMFGVRGASFAFLLGSGMVALAKAEPAELRKLHALLVVDTLSGLGDSVSVDGDRIDHMLRAGVPRDRLDLTVISGHDVTAKAILDHFQKLKVGPSDGLLFYYAGHGATDPEQGHFFALQKLHTAPLLRSDLRRGMMARHAGLVIVVTDCCSTRYSLGKKRKLKALPGAARQLDPALRCLFFQHRGVVDMTAAVEGAAFGDDDEGGLFTRTLAGTIQKHAGELRRASDKFVSWAELFHEVESGTAREFARWSRDQQARGEPVEQQTQKPRAFELPRDPTRPGLALRNGTNKVVRYRCRWGNEGDWEQVVMAPEGARLHLAPLKTSSAESPTLSVEFGDQERATLKVGKTYRYTASTKESRGFEIDRAE
jgi:hypothetical protein